jgi:DNA polymerase beta
MFTRLSSSLSHSRSYSTGPNKAILDLLTRCMKEEDASPSRNGYKVRSFQVAIAAINDHKKPIRSGQEAIKLRGIGLGIANRIDFFLQGKEYDEGLDKQARARLLAIETFQKIPWIGERTSTNLVNAGAASVSDLHLPKYASLLTPTQKVGVLYGDHMTRPVFRAEAAEIVAFIRDHISYNFDVHLTGAYRRESPELPGVNILVSHPQHIHVPAPPPPSTAAGVVSGKTPVRTRGRQRVPFLQVISSVAQRRASPLLQDVVRPLQAAGLLASTLTSSPYKWRGIAILPLRASGDADVNTNGTPGGAWEEVGDRIRDIRATRGKYVRLDLR